jgi:hypothetical protein
MENVSFQEFKEKTEEKEGIVLLGCGGDLKKWFNGVGEVLYKEKILTIEEFPKDMTIIFPESYVLKTTGGRIDLALVVNFDKVDYGKIVMWRLRFGDCSWISDYKVNYESHF